MPPLDRTMTELMIQQQRFDELRREEIRRQRQIDSMAQQVQRGIRIGDRLFVDDSTNVNWSRMAQDSWTTSFATQFVDDTPPFVPEPEVEVSVTEEDEPTLNRDVNEEDEKKAVADNKSFYAKTQGVLDEVSKLYMGLADDIRQYVECDKFFIEKKLNPVKTVDKFLIHNMWSIYRSEKDKAINTFPTLDVIKKIMVKQQMYTFGSECEANTYVYKYMQEIVDKCKPVFESILRLGAIKMNPKNNESNITVNDVEYCGVLNTKRSPTQPYPPSFRSSNVFRINIM